MYDNEFCFAVRECLLFVKDSFSTTPESVVTAHLLHVCLFVGRWKRLVVCSVGECDFSICAPI